MDGKLDKTDLLILKALQQNARITNKELAAKVHLSPSPVFERVRRLENEGYIRKYAALLDAEKLGQGFMVFCSVKLSRMNTEIANDFMDKVKTIPEVTECYNVSGEFDYILKVHAPDMKSYNHFLINVLGRIESIGSIQSAFVMNEVKNLPGVEIL